MSLSPKQRMKPTPLAVVPSVIIKFLLKCTFFPPVRYKKKKNNNCLVIVAEETNTKRIRAGIRSDSPRWRRAQKGTPRSERVVMCKYFRASPRCQFDGAADEASSNRTGRSLQPQEKREEPRLILNLPLGFKCPQKRQKKCFGTD